MEYQSEEDESKLLPFTLSIVPGTSSTPRNFARSFLLRNLTSSEGGDHEEE